MTAESRCSRRLAPVPPLAVVPLPPCPAPYGERGDRTGDTAGDGTGETAKPALIPLAAAAALLPPDPLRCSVLCGLSGARDEAGAPGRRRRARTGDAVGVMPPLAPPALLRLPPSSLVALPLPCGLVKPPCRLKKDSRGLPVDADSDGSSELPRDSTAVLTLRTGVGLSRGLSTTLHVASRGMLTFRFTLSGAGGRGRRGTAGVGAVLAVEAAWDAPWRATDIAVGSVTRRVGDTDTARCCNMVEKGKRA